MPSVICQVTTVSEYKFQSFSISMVHLKQSYAELQEIKLMEIN
jgi:hypothetical protein